MDAAKIIARMKDEYPGANIVVLPQENPTEIICEFDPGKEHPEYSLAIAVIDRSEPHYHDQTVEIYRIVEGVLKLHVGEEEYVMYEGQEFTIIPGKVHWAEGDQTWVEVYSTPAYTKSDHHLCSV